MELGNMAFGHSRGEFRIERGCGFETELARLFDVAFKHIESWSRFYGSEFNNGVWECHPYCWCDGEQCPQCGTGEQPNFKHTKSGLEIKWYKYPLRDSYSNFPLSVRDFAEIIDDCIASLSEQL